MVKVITYGTYDMLHRGHIRLLERAKALGDYLIVGVTSDDYDRTRGKINIQQSLMERIEAVRQTGLADEIIVEEYDGQKIDDIKRLGIDIFTLGSDWEGKFDYLKEYCQVIYLPRTEGISSSEIRSEQRKMRMGIIGSSTVIPKFVREAKYVNGVELVGLCTDGERLPADIADLTVFDSVDALLEEVDSVYIISLPNKHYAHIKNAIQCGKHVLCESPIALNEGDAEELFFLANQNGCILTDGIKTAYSTAYSRLVLMAKTGKIGNIVSVDAVCTSLRNIEPEDYTHSWGSLCGWGPTAMLPVFQILGTDYESKTIWSTFLDQSLRLDGFTKIDFQYPGAVASVKVAKAAKAEGELIITGTKGYIYVPAPWWKTDYFEIRYENPADNRRYFYQLDGEGIRYEIVAFVRMIENGRGDYYVSKDISKSFSRILEQFYNADFNILNR